MDDKKKTRARTTTPTYASGAVRPRYNVKGIGKLGWSLGGLRGQSIGGQRIITGRNSAPGKTSKG